MEDGTRLINQGTMLTALGRDPRPRAVPRRRGVVRDQPPAVHLGEARRDAVDPDHLLRARRWPLPRLPRGRCCPRSARSTWKPANGDLLRSQLSAARAAEILVRGLARVGITVLIDEATGYEEVKARDELQQILEAYVAAELRPWMKMFPDEFFEQIDRLQGLQLQARHIEADTVRRQVGQQVRL